MNQLKGQNAPQCVSGFKSKRTSLYGIPGETRQTLIKVKETADALTNFEWDEWNTSEMDEILKNILPKDNQELNEIKKDKETMSNNLNNEDTSDVNVTFNEKAATPEQKEVNENNETGPSDLEETLWRGYATQLGVTHLKPFQIEAII